MAGGMTQSSPSSGIFFQGQGGNSQLSQNFGNIRANAGPLSGVDISNTLINSIPSSGPSIGGSSLVTDANSRLSAGGPQMQRSASINNEQYMHLPASPMSFSSNNNLNISGSSIMDGSSQQNHIQDGSNPMQKKPRLDVKQEDALQQQHVLQQLLQRQDSMPIQGLNPQMQQALIQQQRFRQQQQQYLQNIPPAQRIHFLQQQQQQQQQLKQQQILQQGNASGLKRPYDGGVCSRRLMQYLYHQRQRPADNTIPYWRKFVAEYYSPRAKKRWCLSLYDNVGHHSLGVFPQASMDAWHCDICGSKSGRGFEATFEVLPRLNEIKFGSGVIDELLFLDMPREIRFPSGMMMLEYAKAVQESVYEQLRVVREGQLRIIFTPDLKIMSWEFCARHHEELLPRRLVAPQVNQLLQVAQKCQNTISENGPEGVSQSDLQANGAMVVNAGRQLARSLELQSLNDLGFSKRYVRCLQIAEVVNSMKDLMDFCRDHKAGPIDGLKNFPRLSTGPKNQMQKGLEMEMQGGQQSSSTDQNAINKLMALQSSSNSPMNNNQCIFNGQGPMNGSQQSAQALSNYQNLMMRQNSMNSNRSSLQHENSSGILLGNSSAQQQFQQHTNGNGASQQNQSLQQQMMQQLIQNMNNKNNGCIPHQQSSSMQNPGMQNQNPGIRDQNPGIRDQNPGIQIQSPVIQIQSPGIQIQNPGMQIQNPVIINGGPRVSDTAVGNTMNRSDSFKAPSGGEPVSRDGFEQKEADLPNNLQLSDDIDNDFMEDGFFNNDILDDSMNFGWKA